MIRFSFRMLENPAIAMIREATKTAMLVLSAIPFIILFFVNVFSTAHIHNNNNQFITNYFINDSIISYS